MNELGSLTGIDRQYGRDDVDYATWYSDWAKRLAILHTRDELENLLIGKSLEAESAARSHLRAIQATTSMNSNSARRAGARNATAAAGEYSIAISGAIEIHDLFPEYAKNGD